METAVRPIEIGEILTESQEMVGAQGRFLYSFQGALEQDFHIPDTLRKPEDQFSTFENRDYKTYEKTLYKRRETYWAGRAEQTLDARQQAWQNDIINWSHDQAESRWVLEQMDGFFNSIGLDNVRDHGFDHQKLSTLYERYFQLPKDAEGRDIAFDKFAENQGKEKRGLKLFVDDAIKAVTKPDGSVNLDEWHRMEAAFVKFSEIFGEPPAEFKKNISMNLLEAELKFKDNPQQFVDLQGNDRRLSTANLNKDEENLLKEIVKEGGIPKVLPFDKESVQKNLLSKIEKYNRVNVEAGTGTGKTTRIGPMVYEKLMKPEDKFLCSQPFKLNASETAKQIARILGVKVGEEVAWMHGDDKSARNTKKERILILTEGTAVHMISDMTEKALNDVVGNNKGKLYFMVDEVHKLTKEGVELSFALIKLQEKFPDRVKLIFATATGDKEKYEKKLNIDKDASVTETGKAYDVHEHWAESGAPRLQDVISMKGNDRRERIASDFMVRFETIIQSGNAKNIMGALPGLGEIEAIDDKITARIKELLEDPNYTHKDYLRNLRISWIHGGSTDEQRESISKNDTVPPYNVYLCTPAAETGITFPNLTHGIGSGMVRHTFYNPELGLNELKLVPSSQAELKQVRGRLGRTEEGEFYYLYIANQDDFDHLQPFQRPSTERSDLVDVMIDFKRMGENDLSKVQALTDFPENEVKSAIITAKRLGIIDENGEFTAAGNEMQGISTDYHLARAIVEGKGKGYAESLVTIASIVELLKNNLFIQLNKENNDPRKDAQEAKRKELVSKVKNGDPNAGIPGIETSDFMVLLKLWREYEETVLTPILGVAVIYDTAKLSGDQMQKLDRAKQQFCDLYGLSRSALESIDNKKQKLIGRVTNHPERMNRGLWAEDVRQRDGIDRALSIGYEDRRMKNDGNKYYLVHNPQSEDDTGWRSVPFLISTRNNPIDPVVLPTIPGNEEIISYSVTKREFGNELVNFITYNQRYKAA